MRTVLKTVATATLALLLLLSLCGCAANVEAPAAAPTAALTAAPTAEPSAEPVVPALEDGIYRAAFVTDSSMFHVNEADKGMGVLTVQNGQMTLHVRMPSQNVVNLFPGLAEDAAKEGAALLSPTTDSVTYDDGMTDEVFGYDIPVPALGQEFDLALLGTKGTWYDHKVKVENPEPMEPVAE